MLQPCLLTSFRSCNLSFHLQVGAIIVSPTRELARQIHTVAQPFLQTLAGVGSLLLVGGT